MVTTNGHCGVAAVAGMSSDTSEASDDGGSPMSAATLAAVQAAQKVNGGAAGAGCMAGSDICRDFLRNVCKRGKRCKFRHPDGVEARHMGRRQEYTFCHDFQNSGCRRANCRFIHCTREEEEYYKQTGQLPVRLQQAAALGIGVLPNELPLMKGEVPICKDFLKGECKRATRCKFRHLTPAQYDMELRRNDPVRTRVASVAETFDAFKEDYVTDRFEANPYENVLKRKRTEELFAADDLHYNLRAALPTPAALTSTDYRLLEEENSMLRRKVEELKKQVSDLVATNEVLLEQNARYRAGKVGTVVVTTSGGMPGQMVGGTMSQVHVTSTIAPTCSTMPPIVAAQSLSLSTQSINTHPQLRLDVANSALVVSQQALQPRLAAALAANLPNLPNLPSLTSLPNLNLTGPGAPGAVSVSMNTLVPVSLGMDTMAPPPGSIAPVSMVDTHPLPTVSLAAAGQTSMAHTLLQQANTANTATLVSYPIMSHSLTPAEIPNTSMG